MLNRNKTWNGLVYNVIVKVSSVVVFDINILANIKLIGKYRGNTIKVKNEKILNMTLCMLVQFWNANIQATVSRDADLIEARCIFQ